MGQKISRNGNGGYDALEKSKSGTLSQTFLNLSTGVYILATFLKSFPYPVVQNQEILPPKMAERFTCAPLDHSNIFFL